jgi:imidazole glycerol phosphate synthase glutamine amidotransferase subunit
VHRNAPRLYPAFPHAGVRFKKSNYFYSMLVIVDYKMGNLHSVKKKLDFLKVDSVISSDPAVILSASKLILPGVGHFGQAMENLRKLNLIDALNEAVLVKKTPILGICLGMQLMARESRETRAERRELDARSENADRVIRRGGLYRGWQREQRARSKEHRLSFFKPFYFRIKNTMVQ